MDTKALSEHEIEKLTRKFVQACFYTPQSQSYNMPFNLSKFQDKSLHIPILLHNSERAGIADIVTAL